MAADDQKWLPFVKQLDTTKVLRPVDRNRLPAHEEGWLVLPCADGHRFRNLWEYHLKICGHGPCHHSLNRNGGTLILGDQSPFAITKSGHRADGVLIDEIEDSLRFKKLRNIAAYTHFPCTAAKEANLSPEEQFDLFETAVTRLRRDFERTRVVAFCHVHYPNDKFFTYFADMILYKSLRSAAGTEGSMCA